MTLFRKFFAVVVMSLTANVAFADVITERQENFSASGKALRMIGQSIGSGDYASVNEEALKLAKWADMIPEYFPEGSESPKASPAIWQNFALFTQFSNDFGAAARALSEASASGDASLMKAKLGEVGATCKQCHSQFKQR